MSHNWDFYYTFSDEQVGVVSVDLELQRSAPDQDRPFLLLISFQLHDPDHFGLMSEHEEPTVRLITEQFRERFEQLGAIHVARTVFSGRFELYFYHFTSRGLEDVLREVNRVFPSYLFMLEVSDDQTWSFYLNELFPSPLDWQRIQSRRTIERLAEAGDRLERRRPVFHRAFFKSGSAAKAFSDAAAKSHFVLVTSEPWIQGGEKRTTVVLKRNDLVAFNFIDVVINELLNLALEYGGVYDGWESEAVVAPTQAPSTGKLFNVQGEAYYGIYPGMRIGGKPAIAFVVGDAYLVAHFAVDGSFLQYTVTDWERPTVVPKEDSLEARSIARLEEHELIRQHLMSNGFASLGTVKVKKFFIDEYGIGITQYPVHLQEALNEDEQEFSEMDASPFPEYISVQLHVDARLDEEELAELREMAEEWRTSGDYVLYNGNDYWCNEEGYIHTS